MTRYCYIELRVGDLNVNIRVNGFHHKVKEHLAVHFVHSMLFIFLNHLRQGQLLKQLHVYPFYSIRRKKGLSEKNTRAKEWQSPYRNPSTSSLHWWNTRLQITARLLPPKLERVFWESFHNCMSLFFWSWWTRLFSRERICHQNIAVGLIPPGIRVKFQNYPFPTLTWFTRQRGKELTVSVPRAIRVSSAWDFLLRYH